MSRLYLSLFHMNPAHILMILYKKVFQYFCVSLIAINKFSACFEVLINPCFSCSITSLNMFASLNEINKLVLNIEIA